MMNFSRLVKLTNWTENNVGKKIPTLENFTFQRFHEDLEIQQAAKNHSNN